MLVSTSGALQFWDEHLGMKLGRIITKYLNQFMSDLILGSRHNGELLKKNKNNIPE